ncbi:MAG TPA: hypothetical protein VI968_02705 [archaeon]|nr:hypothetical protein [archaeon]
MAYSFADFVNSLTHQETWKIYAASKGLRSRRNCIDDDRLIYFATGNAGLNSTEFSHLQGCAYCSRTSFYTDFAITLVSDTPVPGVTNRAYNAMNRKFSTGVYKSMEEMLKALDAVESERSGGLPRKKSKKRK